MAYDVEYTDEFGAWFQDLEESDQNAVAKKVDLLEMIGPALGRPHVDSVEGSRHSNMKELRMSRKAMRVLFAFDPRRQTTCSTST